MKMKDYLASCEGCDGSLIGCSYLAYEASERMNRDPHTGKVEMGIMAFHSLLWGVNAVRLYDNVVPGTDVKALRSPFKRSDKVVIVNAGRMEPKKGYLTAASGRLEALVP